MVKKNMVLGHIISSKGMVVDKMKVESISKIPTQKMVKDIHFILGYVGFCRRFIKIFYNIVRSLSNLNVQHV